MTITVTGRSMRIIKDEPFNVVVEIDGVGEKTLFLEDLEGFTDVVNLKEYHDQVYQDGYWEGTLNEEEI